MQAGIRCRVKPRGKWELEEKHLDEGDDWRNEKKS
jgi:hypothetical protein